tara:strand:+ start:236 stop:364 length:129 start_codon:yes stop_codon:yes gene_type:complete
MNSVNDGKYNHFGGIGNTYHPPKTDEIILSTKIGEKKPEPSS